MFSTKTLARTAATLGAIAALGLGASPAMAAGNGAQVTNTSGCQTFAYGTYCETIHAETNSTSTPSGNSNWQINGKSDYTVTFTDGSTYSSSISLHEHQLIKNGDPQVFSYHFSDTYVQSGYGTCTFSWDYHYANGQIQFDNYNNVCTP